MYRLLIILHITAAMVWLGGMFFAYFSLRPSAGQLLQPPQRLPLWADVLTHFFRWVWIAVIILWITGLSMMQMLGQTPPLYVHMMMGLGLIMTVIFALVFFFPFRILKTRSLEQLWKEAAVGLNQIRIAVATNLILGGLIVILAAGKWPG
ncbi:CopD family protein [Hahella sp. CCB-MM4]|uniref:CopD family protein n=1 Tax=Hahella sp. (strain CCB-MM4) TaxID=1926491 RepID=UPI000B9BF37A|nr:CopD family protein [Hahella sp. CCB-MM4]